jgi:hypothetical protein
MMSITKEICPTSRCLELIVLLQAPDTKLSTVVQAHKDRSKSSLKLDRSRLQNKNMYRHAGSYPTIRRIKDMTHRMHWYALNLGLGDIGG